MPVRGIFGFGCGWHEFCDKNEFRSYVKRLLGLGLVITVGDDEERSVIVQFRWENSIYAL